MNKDQVAGKIAQAVGKVEQSVCEQAITLVENWLTRVRAPFLK